MASRRRTSPDARDTAGKQRAFMTIVCAGIAVALLVANRRA